MFLLYSGCYAISISDKSKPPINFPAHSAHKCHTFSSPVLVTVSFIVDAAVLLSSINVSGSEKYSQI
jgi:hypothetical protein